MSKHLSVLKIDFTLRVMGPVVEAESQLKGNLVTGKVIRNFFLHCYRTTSKPKLKISKEANGGADNAQN